MTKRKHEKRGLGRGLSALMADVAVQNPLENIKTNAGVQIIPVEKITPNPDQPRRDFHKGDLNDLADSIREKGIIQPLIVRKKQDKSDTYEIVAGERRWRASQIAKLHELPVLVRDYTDTEILEVAIIENIQRADLNPVEEAAGYKQLMDRFGHTQEKLAEGLGKSRSHIANLMRLLHLPDSVLTLLRSGDLSMGHARALVTSDKAEQLAKTIVRKGLSVRETERMVKAQLAGSPSPKKTSPIEKDADTRALEGDLAANLGMKVSVDHKTGKAFGKMTISYKSLEQLDDLCRILTTMPRDDSR